MKYAIQTGAICFVALSTPAPAQDVTNAIPSSVIQELREMDSVDGAAVGYSGTPGRFYELLQLILKQAQTSDFVKLANDENPIVRAMGMQCLALKDKAAAIPILQSRLESTASYAFFPGGCVGWGITEGNFAWTLLHNPHALEFDENPTSLLADRELLSLDLGVLANDRCWTFHWEAQNAIPESLKRLQIMDLDLDTIRRATSIPSDLALVKALGRLSPTPETQKALMACAVNKKLAGIIRLAAASALTRDVDPAVTEFLTASANEWSGIEKGIRGDRFAHRQIRRRQACDENENERRANRAYMDTHDPEKEHAAKQAAFAAFEKANSFDEPFAFDDVDDAIASSWAEEDIAMRRRFLQVFLRLAKRFPEIGHPWDTDSDVLLIARHLFEKKPKVDDKFASCRAPGIPSLLTSFELQEAKASLYAALKQLDAESAKLDNDH